MNSLTATDLTSANKQLVGDFIQDLFTRGDLTAVDRYLDPAFVNHDPPYPGAPGGAEGMRSAAAMFRAAFPDWRSDLDQLVAEGDVVVERFTASGTHTGTAVFGAEPSGRRIVLPGVNIFRVVGGRIVERRGFLDTITLMSGLGLLPATMGP
jgi:predicted ester cyclase